MSARAFAVALIPCSILALTACGADARPQTSAGQVGSGDPIFQQFAGRAHLHNCGALALAQGDRLSVAGRKQVACLTAALESGGGAELKVQAPTTEGDPITTYYRVTPDRTTEAFIDSTADAFGPRTWMHTACNHPRTVLQVSC